MTPPAVRATSPIRPNPRAYTSPGAATKRGHDLTTDLLDRLPAHPADRHEVLGVILATLNAEHRRAGTDLHRLATGRIMSPAPIRS